MDFPMNSGAVRRKFSHQSIDSDLTNIMAELTQPDARTMVLEDLATSLGHFWGKCR